MKKNYIAPEVQVITVEVSQLICESLGVSNTNTDSQWSRGDEDWEDDD